MDLLASTLQHRILVLHREHFGETQEVATRSGRCSSMRTLFLLLLLLLFILCTVCIRRMTSSLLHFSPFHGLFSHLVFPSYLLNKQY
jgi:hypothetical protein